MANYNKFVTHFSGLAMEYRLTCIPSITLDNHVCCSLCHSPVKQHKNRLIPCDAAPTTEATVFSKRQNKHDFVLNGLVVTEVIVMHSYRMCYHGIPVQFVEG